MSAVHPLTEKARAATVPIAELLGFLVEEVAGGRAMLARLGIKVRVVASTRARVA